MEMLDIAIRKNDVLRLIKTNAGYRIISFRGKKRGYETVALIDYFDDAKDLMRLLSSVHIKLLPAVVDV